MKDRIEDESLCVIHVHPGFTDRPELIRETPRLNLIYKQCNRVFKIDSGMTCHMKLYHSPNRNVMRICNKERWS